MRPKAHRILWDKQGLSMILVLCIGAVFTALSAALVYAASVLTANANRQLPEQEVYQLATGFSDVLGERLNDENSDFAKFVNNNFMRNKYYGNNPFEDESSTFQFNGILNGDGSDGADEIRITLRRRPGEEVEKLNLNAVGQFVSAGDNDWQQLLLAWQADDYTLTDMQLDVTVTVKKDGESFSYTVTYDRAVHYNVIYYTLNNETTPYRWQENTNKFTVQGGSDREIDPNDTTTQIVPHFDTTNPSHITYTRGVKQKTTATQE